MAELKTKPTAATADSFLADFDEKVRKDSYTLIALMQKVTGQPPVMWGPSIIGFGQYHYKYASGHEGDACLTGFSPRKDKFALYLMGAFAEKDELLQKLGKHKGGKGCLYIKKTEDVNLDVLAEMVLKSVNYIKSNIAGSK